MVHQTKRRHAPPKSRAIIYLVACFVFHAQLTSAKYGSDQYYWNGEVHSEAIGEREILVDMTSLSSGSNSSLTFKVGVKAALYISTSVTDGLEVCSLKSNKLLVQRDAEGNSTELICGNEMAEVHVMEYPFILTFIKGSGPASSQLNKFKISITPIRSYSLDNSFTLNVPPQPRVLYSPLYPARYMDHVSLGVNLNTKTGYAIFFQLRYINIETYGDTNKCRHSLTISGADGSQAENLCDHNLITTVVKPPSSGGGVNVEFKDVHGSLYGSNAYNDNTHYTSNPQGLGYELEYRSVKIGPSFDCSKDAQPRYKVTEATLVTLISSVGDGTNCGVTFFAQPSKVLVLTSLTLKNYWSKLCDSHFLKVFVGDDQLPQTSCGHTAFGSIRAAPGQNIKVEITDKSSTKAVIDFVIEAYEPDALPTAVNGLDYPSYIWKPRLDSSSPFVQVRSPAQSCVEFSIVKDGFKTSDKALSSLMSLYSGSGETGNFELTANCLGRKRSDQIINGGLYRITTAVSEDRKAFWFTFVSKGGRQCEAPPTDLEIASLDIQYSLFQRVAISRHMSCMFVLPPKVTPKIMTGTRFKGHLRKMDGAELFVKKDKNSSNIIADFEKLSTSHDGWTAWIYSSDILYIYFRTGSDVSDDMAKFNYGARYSATDEYNPSKACPGPFNINLYTSADYYTPDYPNHLEANVACRWRFQRANYQHPVNYFHVSIDDLDLPCDSTTKLYIKEMDKPNSGSNLVCGKKEFFQVYPGNIEIQLIGGSDHLIKGIKFHVLLKGLAYERVCNNTYDINTGKDGFHVTGTLSDGHFLIPFYCTIKLYSSRPDERLTVTLNTVNIMDSQFSHFECFRNGLTIIDGPTVKSPVLIHTCYNRGEVVVSTGNHIMIIIDIKQKVERPVTFDLEIKKKEGSSCHGMVSTIPATENSQFLTSPSYPKHYPRDSDCQWRIESETGDQVEIEITYMDLEYSRSCYYDYLEIFDGRNFYSPSLDKICGKLSNRPMFRSSSEVLYLRFRSDSHEEYGGFKIRYYTRKLPSPGLENGGQTKDGDGDEGSGNKTGVIIGACLSAIVGVFGIGFLCVWLVHKKRVRDQRSSQRRRREASALHLNSLSQESSVFVINPMIFNGAPPPYSGLANQGFLEEPPPSYNDALSQLNSPTAQVPAEDDGEDARPPPPPYSLSTPRGHEAICETDEPTYDNLTQENTSNVPTYEALRSPRRMTSNSSTEGSGRHTQQADATDNNESTQDSVYSYPQDGEYTELEERSSSSVPEYNNAHISPENSGGGEYNLAYQPEDNERGVYSVSRQHNRDGRSGQDLAHQTESNQTSAQNHLRRRQNSHSSEDVGPDSLYSLADLPDGLRRGQASATRTRSDSDNYDQSRQVEQRLAGNRNRRNSDHAGIHGNSTEHAQRSRERGGGSRSRTRSPVDGTELGHSPDRRNNRPPRQNDSLGSF